MVEVLDRLVYKRRVATLRSTVDRFRDDSVSGAVRHQMDGFGHNNRALIRGK